MDNQMLEDKNITAETETEKSPEAPEVSVSRLKTIVDLLSEIELHDSVAERFEPQLSKITQRMLRLHFSVEHAMKTIGKRIERSEAKTERKATRRVKLLKMMEKIKLELEKTDDEE